MLSLSAGFRTPSGRCPLSPQDRPGALHGGAHVGRPARKSGGAARPVPEPSRHHRRPGAFFFVSVDFFLLIVLHMSVAAHDRVVRSWLCRCATVLSFLCRSSICAFFLNCTHEYPRNPVLASYNSHFMIIALVLPTGDQ